MRARKEAAADADSASYAGMQTVEDVAEFRRILTEARAKGRRIGFVPTMGALHEGHLALVREAKKHGDYVCVSIFVNPTQFGPNEDFARYPRTLEADSASLGGLADCIFAPNAEAIYPEDDQTRVRVGALAEPLCGPFRPGHFEGVCTVVTKLFAIVGPCVAVFGRKDYQQLAVLRRVVQDLFLPVEMVGVPIVREKDGLALSSRNRYLSEEERARALVIPRALTSAVNAFNAGERNVSVLREGVRASIAASTDRIDYVELTHPDTLQILGASERVLERSLFAVACHIGKTRLIDNVVLGEDPAPIRQS